MSSRDLTDALEALTNTSRYGGGLPEATARGAVASVKASAVPATSPKDSSGGGITAPLTETAYADRTWWPGKNVKTTDGLFTINQRCLKSINFNDAAGKEVVMNFKDNA